ncbi:MAG: hypothetical protein JW751_14875 [Polyangiaceae bacterium]|nr:hypothetical protein [Polyangiaceae bacterium]
MTLKNDLDRTYRNLSAGNVSDPSSVRMRHGLEGTVSARVSRDCALFPVEVLRGEVEVERTATSPDVEACLMGNEREYEIRSLDGPSGDTAGTKSCWRQTVAGDYANWNWGVMPLKAGQRDLELLFLVAVVQRSNSNLRLNSSALRPGESTPANPGRPGFQRHCSVWIVSRGSCSNTAGRT